MQVNYDTYKSMDFTCNKCGWRGKGKELSHGDFSESSFIGNLQCPKCFELIAYWQAPLSDKSDTNIHPRRGYKSCQCSVCLKRDNGPIKKDYTVRFSISHNPNILSAQHLLPKCHFLLKSPHITYKGKIPGLLSKKWTLNK